MNDKLCKRESCTGCLACVASCPKKAISAEYDFMGFSYPKIDEEKCISCNICTGKCHVKSPEKRFAHKNIYRYCGGEQIQMLSSSGGFIPLLTEYCVKNGFYICGVVFSEDFLSARYVVTRSNDLLMRMRKSKYVEADLGSALSEIKNLLDSGEKVLFVGLPCHVAAIKKIAGNRGELLTVDLICHGNGSPKYYKESLGAFCKSYGRNVSDIKNVDFRPKPELPGRREFEIGFDGATVRVQAEKFPYYYGFNSRLVFRDSCYDCEYSGSDRIGDVTAGDSTFTDSNLGESIVIANTDNGSRILRELLKYGGFTEVSIEETEALKKRFQPKFRPKYCLEIKKIKKYDKLEKTYLSPGFVPIKYRIKKIIKKIIRRK